MRYLTFTFLAFLPLATLCPTAVGQAAAEYGLGAARAATTTAPARNLGTSMSDLFGSLNKAAQPDQTTAEPEPSAPRPATPKPKRSVQSKQSTAAVGKKAVASEPTPAEPVASAPPVPVYEDPRQIQAGIGYDEMVRRFGPPSMSITSESGRRTLWYSSGDTNYQVEVEDGKVIAPRRTASE